MSAPRDSFLFGFAVMLMISKAPTDLRTRCIASEMLDEPANQVARHLSFVCVHVREIHVRSYYTSCLHL